MSYGSTAYGSAALGGSAANEWYVFFPFVHRAQGTHQAEAEVFTDEQWFSLFLQKSAEETDAQFQAFTRNDLGETPQSQGFFGGLFAQHVIPAARFIKVVAVLNNPGGDITGVRGRPGD